MKKRKVNRERECLFRIRAKRKHHGERGKSCWYVSECVWIRSPSQKQETRGWESLTKPGVPREQVQRSRRENKGRMQPPKNSSSLLSSCPPHQLTQLQQTSPMLSSTTCQLKPWAPLEEKQEKHLGRRHPDLPTKAELATQKGAGETDTLEPHKTGRNRPRASCWSQGEQGLKTKLPTI